MLFKGKLTVVATGNIWVADPIVFEGKRTGDLPATDNPNALGLIALGVVKVVDPGIPTYSYVTNNGFNGPKNVSGFTYVPVANYNSGAEYSRILTTPWSSKRQSPWPAADGVLKTSAIEKTSRPTTTNSCYEALSPKRCEVS